MNPPPPIAFDLDGVLVDTIGTLYSAYLSILSEMGAQGTPAEFDYLNGKNVQEIAEHLTCAHSLPCTELELIGQFQTRFDSLYSNVDLIAGALSLLEFLRNQGTRLALASSSNRKNIDVILKRFDLGPFFELIVSGDDVKHAKPSPDIYNLVKLHFGTNRCIVVEDSANGVQAAQDAGLFTVYFNSNGSQRELSASYTVNHLDEIKPIALNASKASILVATCDDVRLTQTSVSRSIPSRIQNQVEAIWETQQAARPELFDDPICCYRAHTRSPAGELLIEVDSSRYRYFLAQLEEPSINLVYPLAVSGIALDINQKVLVGKRDARVSEYPGHYEFVPSGGISSETLEGRPFQPQLAIELEEETGLPLSAIEKTVPLGLIFDRRHGVYDIGVLVHLAIDLDQAELKSTEYSEFRQIDFAALGSFLDSNPFVPASRVLLDAIPNGLLHSVGGETLNAPT